MDAMTDTPGKEVCAACNGSGRVLMADYSKGKSKVSVGRWSEPCDVCEGSGFIVPGKPKPVIRSVWTRSQKTRDA